MPQIPKYFAIFRWLFLVVSFREGRTGPPGTEGQTSAVSPEAGADAAKGSGTPQIDIQLISKPLQGSLPYIWARQTIPHKRQISESEVICVLCKKITLRSPLIHRDTFFSNVSIATWRWRPIKVIVRIIIQTQKIPWGLNYIFRLNEPGQCLFCCILYKGKVNDDLKYISSLQSAIIAWDAYFLWWVFVMFHRILHKTKIITIIYLGKTIILFLGKNLLRMSQSLGQVQEL